MAEYNTKYTIGDKVYIITYGSLASDVDIELKEITGVKFVGNTSVRYEFGSLYSRSEIDIYTDLEKAIEKAIDSVKEKAENRITYLKEKTLKEVELT